MKTKQELLETLADAEGWETVEDMLAETGFDSVSPAICTNCEEVTEMEPDQRRGYCDGCGKNKVQSAFVLAGLL